MEVKRQDLRVLNQQAITTLQNIGELGVGAAAEGVPEDFKRYVYYYKASNPFGSATVLSIFQSLGGVLTLLDQVDLTQNTNYAYPTEPEPENPILEFEQSGFIAVQTSAVAGSGVLQVSMGYYDAPPE